MQQLDVHRLHSGIKMLTLILTLYGGTITDDNRLPGEVLGTKHLVCVSVYDFMQSLDVIADIK